MSDPLTEEEEFLLQSIRDLDEEHAAGDLEDVDYRTLRDDYTARAAAVLRRMEGGEAAVPAEAAPAVAQPAGARARGAGWRSKVLIAGLVVAAISGGAGYAVANSSDERSAMDEVSGEIVRGTTDRITEAQLLARDGRILDAVKVYDEVLVDDPENPVALAQKGWLLSRVGEPSLIDSGLASIDRAITVEPDYADAYFFRGMILWRAKGDPASAVETFQRGIATRPPPDLLASFQEVKQLAEADAAGTAPPPATAPSPTP